MLWLEESRVDNQFVNNADTELDVKGLNCPMPLQSKKSANDMEAGMILRVLATDPGSERDFEIFARQSGNICLTQLKETESIAIIFGRKIELPKLISDWFDRYLSNEQILALLLFLGLILFS